MQTQIGHRRIQHLIFGLQVSVIRWFFHLSMYCSFPTPYHPSKMKFTNCNTLQLVPLHSFNLHFSTQVQNFNKILYFFHDLLLVLIRSASPRCFSCVPTTYIYAFMEKKEKCHNCLVKKMPYLELHLYVLNPGSAEPEYALPSQIV